MATAENATQALQRLEQLGRIDVLFTDLGLPGGMNGAELAEEVRRRHPDVHIICTTGAMPKTTFFALSPGRDPADQQALLPEHAGPGAVLSRQRSDQNRP